MDPSVLLWLDKRKCCPLHDKGVEVVQNFVISEGCEVLGSTTKEQYDLQT